MLKFIDIEDVNGKKYIINVDNIEQIDLDSKIIFLSSNNIGIKVNENCIKFLSTFLLNIIIGE